MKWDFAQTWLNVLLKPKEVFRNEKKNASTGKALINYYIAFLFYFLLWFIIGYLLDYDYMTKPLEQKAIIFLTVLGAPFAVTLLVSIWEGVIGLLSIAFKGKGKKEEQFIFMMILMTIWN